MNCKGRLLVRGQKVRQGIALECLTALPTPLWIITLVAPYPRLRVKPVWKVTLIHLQSSKSWGQIWSLTVVILLPSQWWQDDSVCYDVESHGWSPEPFVTFWHMSVIQECQSWSVSDPCVSCYNFNERRYEDIRHFLQHFMIFNELQIIVCKSLIDIMANAIYIGVSLKCKVTL